MRFAVPTSNPQEEGPERVKWELGLTGLCPGKMGFKSLALGFGHWEWE